MENQKLQPFNNLTKDKRTPLQKLSQRDDIKITKANKSGAVVIVDIKGCIREAECQLRTKDNYDSLKCDLTDMQQISKQHH